MRKRFAPGALMLAINCFGCVYSNAQALTAAKYGLPASRLSPSLPAKVISAGPTAAKNKPAIEVTPLAVKANEFPSAVSGQMKVAFECTIVNVPPQSEFDVFPRYRCDLDKPRTVEINKLTIQRVDQFPSVDGITTKIVVVAHHSSKDTPRPARLHAAFQLYRDQSAGNSVGMLKEFLYVDAMF